MVEVHGYDHYFVIVIFLIMFYVNVNHCDFVYEVFWNVLMHLYPYFFRFLFLKQITNKLQTNTNKAKKKSKNMFICPL